MTTLTHILAATDFSGDAALAVQRAASLALEHDARLTVLNVVSEPSVVQLRLGLRAGADVEKMLVGDARHSMQTLLESLPAGVADRVNGRVEVGAVLDTLLAAMQQGDLLVVGPRGLHPAQGLFLGSIAERLLTRMTRPVLVAKAAVSSYRRVIVPVDFSPHSASAIAVARAVAPQAAIEVLHAFECPYESRLQLAGVEPAVLESYRRDAAAAARSALDALLSSLSATLTSSVAEGDPRAVIAKHAADSGADLIVMGKHGRSMLSEFFLGGTTRAVLAHSVCDVLVVPEVRSQGISVDL
jgi:nucleotide-binding universal stress UspA family protein